MIFVALAVLALAALVGLGRAPWLARRPSRLAALGLAVVAGAAAAYDAARGGWLGGSILGSAALWLALSAGRPRSLRRDDLAEAAATLGVTSSASREEVDAAYRRLMLRVHPDVGGTPALAARLNAARARLLDGR